MFFLSSSLLFSPLFSFDCLFFSPFFLQKSPSFLLLSFFCHLCRSFRFDFLNFCLRFDLFRRVLFSLFNLILNFIFLHFNCADLLNLLELSINIDLHIWLISSQIFHHAEIIIRSQDNLIPLIINIAKGNRVELKANFFLNEVQQLLELQFFTVEFDSVFVFEDKFHECLINNYRKLRFSY